MALVLSQNATCPHCGQTSAPVRDSLHLFSDDDGRSVDACDQLSPPSALSLDPLSLRETVTFGVGLFAVLAIGIGPVMLLPFLMPAIDPSIMALSAFWALVCPYVYLRSVERHLRRLHGDEALARWNRLVYCATCRAAFIPEERQLVSINNVHVLLYD